MHDCNHESDVILSCLTEGTVRLVSTGGDDTLFSSSGRLEVYIDGLWGTVCANGFTNVSANVVCEQLGFSVQGIWTTIGELE